MSNMVIDNKNKLFVDADTVHFLQSARKQVWCDIVVGSGSLKWRDIFISFLQLWFVNVDDAPEVAPALVIDITEITVAKDMLYTGLMLSFQTFSISPW